MDRDVCWTQKFRLHVYRADSKVQGHLHYVLLGTRRIHANSCATAATPLTVVHRAVCCIHMFIMLWWNTRSTHLSFHPLPASAYEKKLLLPFSLVAGFSCIWITLNMFKTQRARGNMKEEKRNKRTSRLLHTRSLLNIDNGFFMVCQEKRLRSQ